jgi:hypothetical protein
MHSPCKKHHITASTLTHHNSLRQTIRNQLTAQKPLCLSTIMNVASRRHSSTTNLPPCHLRKRPLSSLSKIHTHPTTSTATPVLARVVAIMYEREILHDFPYLSTFNGCVMAATQYIDALLLISLLSVS